MDSLVQIDQSRANDFLAVQEDNNPPPMNMSANGLFAMHEAYLNAFAPFSFFSDLTSKYLLDLSRTPAFNAFPVLQRATRLAGANWEMCRWATQRDPKPPFGLDAEERREVVLPWGSLVHFLPNGKEQDGEPVMVISANAMNKSSMMRNVSRELLNHGHNVYHVDWEGAENVPLSKGYCHLTTYMDYLHTFMNHMGERAHLVVICQAGPAADAATALTYQLNGHLRPRTLTVIASPMDTSINPGPINISAQKRSVDWVDTYCMDTVPQGFPGAGRRVFSGITQLLNLTMEALEYHKKKGKELYNDIVDGRDDEANKLRSFYQDFRARHSGDRPLLLETFWHVFKNQSLTKGELFWGDVQVDPAAITDTALFAIEGLKDRICPPGQTSAFLAWSPGLPASMRQAKGYKGGHYSVWSEDIWRNEVSHDVTAFIRSHSSPHLYVVPRGP
jgi:poly(3-hydroxybutyrate) depolymerase